MFFEGAQKYFVKVEMMWSNFQATRDARDARARADLAVRARWNTQKKYQKIAKN